ncbi:hypothetical protein PGT21_017775 [Puccinia graminis f. sp. tritici]|uniref:Uncharacterized protein n=1 Tax=Puccinia graminis f. sp. tritici TaxID=56615 RepID=A0A5B0PL53_PUCGR|nr:hypothetical protein PGT21_017775 [Puccinia graminis f. sp. tritici]
MLPVDHDDDESLLQGVALCEVFNCSDHWEPWKDKRIPAARFVELFRMSLANFNGTIYSKTHLGAANLRLWKPQVAVGLDHLGHGSS